MAHTDYLGLKLISPRQEAYLWRELHAVKRALRAVVEAFEEEPQGRAVEHYLRLEAAVREAKELL